MRDDFPDGSLGTDEEDAEFGLNARWSITPNLALNATYNPDFSQVEADTAQLAINTRFALFFPEKRPFFLEGADFFETPLQVIFTRTLAEPNYGVKLTGKEGKSAVGAYIVEDDITNFIVPSNQRTLFGQIDDEMLNGVLRYRYDLGSRSTIGVLYAGRDGDEYSNEVAGADAFVAINQSNIIRAQYVTSDTKYPQRLRARQRRRRRLPPVLPAPDPQVVLQGHLRRHRRGFPRRQRLHPAGRFPPRPGHPRAQLLGHPRDLVPQMGAGRPQRGGRRPAGHRDRRRHRGLRPAGRPAAELRPSLRQPPRAVLRRRDLRARRLDPLRPDQPHPAHQIRAPRSTAATRSTSTTCARATS